MKLILYFVTGAIFACGNTIVLATPQAAGHISYGGHEYVLFQVPMLGLWHNGVGDVPKGKMPTPRFEVTSSANWAGYSACWEIRNHQLLLCEIEGRINGKNIRNDEILRGRRFPVVAKWFTGRIHIAVGDLNDETNEYESVIVFEVVNGSVKGTMFHTAAKICRTWNGL